MSLINAKNCVHGCKKVNSYSKKVNYFYMIRFSLYIIELTICVQVVSNLEFNIHSRAIDTKEGASDLAGANSERIVQNRIALSGGTSLFPGK